MLVASPPPRHQEADLGRKPPEVTTDADNEIRVPGAYEHVLAEVVHEAIADPYAALRDRTVEERVEEERNEEALVQAEIEIRRGTTVLCQNHDLPSAVYRLFGNPGNRSWEVSPDDTVRLRPRRPTARSVTGTLAASRLPQQRQRRTSVPETGIKTFRQATRP